MSGNGFHHTHLRQLLPWAVALLTLLPHVALGHQRPTPPGEISFSRPELEKMMEALQLSNEQRGAARALYDGLQAEVFKKGEKLRSVEAKRRDEPSRERKAELLVAWQKEFGALVIARTDAEAAFVADFESILTPAQLANSWPGVQRGIRRAELKNMNGPTIGMWFRADLAIAAEKADLGQELSNIQATLDTWKLEIDVPIVQRRAMWTREMHLPPEHQERIAEDLEDRDVALGVRTAEINRKYFRIIVGELSEGAAARFTDTVYKRVYQDIYSRPRRAEAMLEAVDHFDDLDDSQRTSLSELRAKYQTESRALDEQAVAEIEKSNDGFAKFRRLPLEQRDVMSRAGDDPETVVLRSIQDRRARLEANTVEAILDLLSPKQRSSANAVGK